MPLPSHRDSTRPKSSLREIVEEFVANELKFPQTLVAFFLQPGRLSADVKDRDWKNVQKPKSYFGTALALSIAFDKYAKPLLSTIYPPARLSSTPPDVPTLSSPPLLVEYSLIYLSGLVAVLVAHFILSLRNKEGSADIASLIFSALYWVGSNLVFMTIFAEPIDAFISEDSNAFWYFKVITWLCLMYLIFGTMVRLLLHLYAMKDAWLRAQLAVIALFFISVVCYMELRYLWMLVFSAKLGS